MIKGTTELLDDVISGKLDYTIADSVAIVCISAYTLNWPSHWMSLTNNR